MKKIMHTLIAILQLFATGGGEVVNATGNFVNAYTGATTNFDTTHSFAGEIKTFYDTTLLMNARAEMYYAQFAATQPLPKGRGKTVEWRRWNTFARASKLQEGVIPTGQKFGMTVKTGSIEQYGTYTAVSDQLEAHAYDDVILGASEEMGASAAETQEVLIRDALLTNTNVLYCDNITLATGAVASTPTSCATMEASATAMSMFTPTMAAKAVTIMKKNKVPTINGKYYAVIHPSVAFDLRNHKDWIDVHKYAAVSEIFNGEIGEIHGMRFVEDTFAPILGGSTYQNKEGTKTYATYCFGKDAFGIIDPEEGGLEMIVKSKEQAGGPLNQFSTVGYKFETNGATVLYTERVLRIMSCSSYSATDDTN
ncbi:MAG: N4-gp56 family major capsid protein [Candidatus Faecousia sp.]|nr:N4-gp56 family major capsid protein [Candidatus Faecousia sp.]